MRGVNAPELTAWVATTHPPPPPPPPLSPLSLDVGFFGGAVEAADGTKSPLGVITYCVGAALTSSGRS